MKYKAILLILLSCSVLEARSRQTIKPERPSESEMRILEKAFKNSWHKLKLDEVDEDDGNSYKANSFALPLPIWKLKLSCRGSKMYYFDLADYNLITKSKETFNFGDGYTGSAGTRRLILALDPEKNEFRIVFDENIIEILGGYRSVVSGQSCPQIDVLLSGANFKNAKDNYDYRIVHLSYNLSSRKYGWILSEHSCCRSNKNLSK